MSGDGIFQIGHDDQLISLLPTPFAAEDALQALLETHPDLLAGGQMAPESPRRWALVKREQGVPDREDAASRWSVDHLFVDQDAVPTLVEVKRSTDTRIRREVVGQMLDYAANGVRYWPVDRLRTAYEATQAQLGNDPLETLVELTEDSGTSVEEFFERVGDNLRSGRIRMVFVADVVPDELMRIVEFLNEQMTPAEVFAVQVKQYRAEGHEGSVIVPAVFGRTAAASRKSGARGRPDRATLLAASTPATVDSLLRLQRFADEHGVRLRETGGGAALETLAGQSIAHVYLSPWDAVEVPLRALRRKGWMSEADAFHAQLRALTTKTLTRELPAVPTDDAVREWDRMTALLRSILELYSSTEERDA